MGPKKQPTKSHQAKGSHRSAKSTVTPDTSKPGVAKPPPQELTGSIKSFFSAQTIAKTPTTPARPKTSPAHPRQDTPDGSSPNPRERQKSKPTSPLAPDGNHHSSPAPAPPVMTASSLGEASAGLAPAPHAQAIPVRESPPSDLQETTSLQAPDTDHPVGPEPNSQATHSHCHEALPESSAESGSPTGSSLLPPPPLNQSVTATKAPSQDLPPGTSLASTSTETQVDQETLLQEESTTRASKKRPSESSTSTEQPKEQRVHEGMELDSQDSPRLDEQMQEAASGLTTDAIQQMENLDTDGPLGTCFFLSVKARPHPALLTMVPEQTREKFQPFPSGRPRTSCEFHLHVDNFLEDLDRLKGNPWKAQGRGFRDLSALDMVHYLVDAFKQPKERTMGLNYSFKPRGDQSLGSRLRGFAVSVGKTDPLAFWDTYQMVARTNKKGTSVVLNEYSSFFVALRHWSGNLVKYRPGQTKKMRAIGFSDQANPGPSQLPPKAPPPGSHSPPHQRASSASKPQPKTLNHPSSPSGPAASKSSGGDKPAPNPAPSSPTSGPYRKLYDEVAPRTRGARNTTSNPYKTIVSIKVPVNDKPTSQAMNATQKGRQIYSSQVAASITSHLSQADPKAYLVGYLDPSKTLHSSMVKGPSSITQRQFEQFFYNWTYYPGEAPTAFIEGRIVVSHQSPSAISDTWQLIKASHAKLNRPDPLQVRSQAVFSQKMLPLRFCAHPIQEWQTTCAAIIGQIFTKGHSCNLEEYQLDLQAQISKMDASLSFVLKTGLVPDTPEDDTPQLQDPQNWRNLAEMPEAVLVFCGRSQAGRLLQVLTQVLDQGKPLIDLPGCRYVTVAENRYRHNCIVTQELIDRFNLCVSLQALTQRDSMTLEVGAIVDLTEHRIGGDSLNCQEAIMQLCQTDTRRPLFDAVAHHPYNPGTVVVTLKKHSQDLSGSAAACLPALLHARLGKESEPWFDQPALQHSISTLAAQSRTAMEAEVDTRRVSHHLNQLLRPEDMEELDLLIASRAEGAPLSFTGGNIISNIELVEQLRLTAFGEQNPEDQMGISVTHSRLTQGPVNSEDSDDTAGFSRTGSDFGRPNEEANSSVAGDSQHSAAVSITGSTFGQPDAHTNASVASGWSTTGSHFGQPDDASNYSETHSNLMAPLQQMGMGSDTSTGEPPLAGGQDAATRTQVSDPNGDASSAQDGDHMGPLPALQEQALPDPPPVDLTADSMSTSDSEEDSETAEEHSKPGQSSHNQDMRPLSHQEVESIYGTASDPTWGGCIMDLNNDKPDLPTASYIRDMTNDWPAFQYSLPPGPPSLGADILQQYERMTEMKRKALALDTPFPCRAPSCVCPWVPLDLRMELTCKNRGCQVKLHPRCSVEAPWYRPEHHAFLYCSAQCCQEDTEPRSAILQKFNTRVGISSNRPTLLISHFTRTAFVREVTHFLQGQPRSTPPGLARDVLAWWIQLLFYQGIPPYGTGSALTLLSLQDLQLLLQPFLSLVASHNDDSQSSKEEAS